MTQLLELFRGFAVTWTAALNRLFIRSLDVLHTQIAFLHCHLDGSFVSTYIHPILLPKLARGPWEDREDIRGRCGGSRVLIKGVRASAGISLLAVRGVVAFRRECTGMNGRGGDRRLRNGGGGTRGEFGGESGMHASKCVCALCVHAVLRCAWFGTRTEVYLRFAVAGSVGGHARGYLSAAREAARNGGVKQDNKTAEGELAVPEDSRCRLIRSTRR